MNALVKNHLIKIAYYNPELRQDLLPIIIKIGNEHLGEFKFKKPTLIAALIGSVLGFTAGKDMAFKNKADQERITANSLEYKKMTDDLEKQDLSKITGEIGDLSAKLLNQGLPVNPYPVSEYELADMKNGSPTDLKIWKGIRGNMELTQAIGKADRMHWDGNSRTFAITINGKKYEAQANPVESQ